MVINENADDRAKTNTKKPSISSPCRTLVTLVVQKEIVFDTPPTCIATMAFSTCLIASLAPVLIWANDTLVHIGIKPLTRRAFFFCG